MFGHLLYYVHRVNFFLIIMSASHLLSTYRVLVTLFLTVCVEGIQRCPSNEILFLSPHLLNYKMTLVFHMASAPLRIALPRKQIAEQRHCS